MSLSNELQEAIEHWLVQDPDEGTRAALASLRDRAAHDESARTEIHDMFRAPLEFGTAGLRGEMGPGPNRMNRVSVMQAAAGLANYLVAQGFAGAPVVIGFDARHNSAVFAHDTAEIMAGAGLVPVLSPTHIPTPVLAYAIHELSACAGVMVTASHNPAADNGYKVYLGDGRQIVPPADKDIAAAIREVKDVRSIVRATRFETLPESIIENYVARIAALIGDGPTSQEDRAQLSWTYTAMHGVGWHTINQVSSACEFAPADAVLAQRDPDADFPTVAFPNPEEPGALDLALAMARERKSDLIIANDPDADRLSVSVANPDGTWAALTGDQVGALLAWWLIERAKLMGRPLVGAMANSIVSSSLLERIAHDAGLAYAHTLTGFKWVSRVPQLQFGYEEALGYCVDPTRVSDKDGISAAAFVLELAAWLKSQGKTVWTVLDEIATTHGLFVTSQLSIRVTSLEQIQTAMSTMRTSPPLLIGEFFVENVVDLAQGFDGLPPTDGIMLFASGQHEVKEMRIIVRPSGTEPKVKAYIQLVVEVADSVEAARQVGAQKVATVREVLQDLLSN